MHTGGWSSTVHRDVQQLRENHRAEIAHDHLVGNNRTEQQADRTETKIEYARHTHSRYRPLT